jgi:hypothetical protein
MSDSDKISLGIGLGVGLPGTLAGVWAAWVMSETLVTSRGNALLAISHKLERQGQDEPGIEVLALVTRARFNCFVHPQPDNLE